MYDLTDVEVSKSYSEEIDCQFYSMPNAPHTELILKPSYMAVFFPNDIHQPQQIVEEQIDNIKKIVN